MTTVFRQPSSTTNTGSTLNIWQANSNILDGVTVITPGGATVARNGTGTSGATYDAAEAGNYVLRDVGPVQTVYPGAGVYLYAGQTIMLNNALYSWPADGATTNAAFTAGDWNTANVVSDTTQEFNSVADFQASSNIPDQIKYVVILGYHGINTAGGGTFNVDRTDTTTADNSGTILVNADGLRIKRDSQGPLKASWFGCVPDGVNRHTEKQALFLAAQTANQDVKFDQAGTYLIDGQDTVSSTNLDHGQKFRISGVDGAIFNLAASNLNKLLEYVTTSVASSLTTDFVKGSNIIELANPVKAGDYIWLLVNDDTSASNLPVWEQTIKVSRINDAGQAVVDRAKFLFPSGTYTLPDGVTTFSTTALILNKIPDIEISNLQFVFDIPGINDINNARQAFKIWGADCSIKDCKISTSREPEDSEDGFFNLPGLLIARYATIVCENITAENSGYTLWFQYTRDARIDTFTGRNIRHFVTTNNAGSISVSNGRVVNGGAIDAHGASGRYSVTNVTSSNPDGQPLDNIRSYGDIYVSNCEFFTGVLNLALTLNVYLDAGWASTATNFDFAVEAFARSVYVENTYVTGDIRFGNFQKYKTIKMLFAEHLTQAKLT